MSTEKSLKQIKMSEQHHSMLKALAKENNKYLNEICNDALKWFVSQRSNLNQTPRKKPHNHQYVVSPKLGNYQSYWLSSEVLKDVARICTTDNMTESRVIYTAFISYLQKQGRHLQSIN